MATTTELLKSDLFKQYKVDFDRPLIPEDIEMIKRHGRPLTNFEIKQLNGVIPFEAIMGSEDQAQATQIKGYNRANAIIQQSKQPTSDIDPKRLAEAKKDAPLLLARLQDRNRLKSLLRAGTLTTGDTFNDVLSSPNIPTLDESGTIVKETGGGDMGGTGGSDVGGTGDIVEDTGSTPITGDITGVMEFNTGNQQIDDFLNNTWLPLLEAELAGDPTAILNDELFDNIKQRIEATWGPIFQKELDMAQEAYTRGTEAVTASGDKTQRQLDLELTRGIEDAAKQKSRIEENVQIGSGRIARNYQEALMESQAAMANRGLTFSGIRDKEEARLLESKEEQIGDIEREAGRSLEDLRIGQERLQSDVPYEQEYQAGVTGRSMSELESAYAEEQRRIEGEQLLQEAAEKERLRTLGGELMANPEFNPAF